MSGRGFSYAGFSERDQPTSPVSVGEIPGDSGEDSVDESLSRSLQQRKPNRDYNAVITIYRSYLR